MLVLITYDINITEAAGARRLRRVAKQCVNYGTRVQNSVFECQVDATQYVKLKHLLMKEIDEEKDVYKRQGSLHVRGCKNTV